MCSSVQGDFSIIIKMHFLTEFCMLHFTVEHPSTAVQGLPPVTGLQESHDSFLVTIMFTQCFFTEMVWFWKLYVCTDQKKITVYFFLPINLENVLKIVHVVSINVKYF